MEMFTCAKKSNMKLINQNGVTLTAFDFSISLPSHIVRENCMLEKHFPV